jgi:hypothetical protein
VGGSGLLRADEGAADVAAKPRRHRAQGAGDEAGGGVSVTTAPSAPLRRLDQPAGVRVLGPHGASPR